MIPLAIDPSRLRVGLAARGAPGRRRLGLLQAGGATDIAVFTDQPDRALSPAIPHLPDADEIAGLHVLWVAGIPRAEAAELARIARARRVPVNVEDAPDLCDFHNVAEVRRGDLLITISTGGRSPGLAAAIRQALDRQFGPEWVERLRTAADQRRQWREAGLDMPAVRALLDELAHSKGWLQ